MKRRFILLPLIILAFFLSLSSLCPADDVSLPDISILNDKNSVPKARGSVESMGRVWNTVELDHYKVYYLPEHKFPTDDMSYKEYMNNINFLLPRLDNVYVFLSRWFNTGPDKTKISVYYVGDKNQMRIYNMANDIYALTQVILWESKKAFKKEPKNKYWLDMEKNALLFREKYKEKRFLMKQAVGKEYVVLNLLGYKKNRFIDWLVDEGARDAEFDNVLENELPFGSPQEAKTRKIMLCEKILNTKEDITIDYGSTLKKSLSARGQQIAEMLFNNNPSYLAELVNIDYGFAKQLLKFKASAMPDGQCALFPLSAAYFNYARSAPAMDLALSAHIFSGWKNMNADKSFVMSALDLYFANQAVDYFDCLSEKKKYDFYGRQLKQFKQKYPTFDFYLKNDPLKTSDKNKNSVSVSECVRFLYLYMEQKDKSAFYEFLQYMLGDKNENVCLLKPQDGIYKTYGLNPYEFNEKLKKYYDTGVVE